MSGWGLTTAGGAQGEAERTAAFAQAVAMRNIGLAILLAEATAAQAIADAEQEAADTERYANRNIGLLFQNIDRMQADAEQTATEAGNTAEAAPGYAMQTAEETRQAAIAAFAQAYCSETGKTIMNQGGDCVDAAMTVLRPHLDDVGDYGSRVFSWAQGYPSDFAHWFRCKAVDITNCGGPPGGFPGPGINPL